MYREKVTDYISHSHMKPPNVMVWNVTFSLLIFLKTPMILPL